MAKDLHGLTYHRIQLLTVMTIHETFTCMELALSVHASYISTLQVLKRMVCRKLVNVEKVTIDNASGYFWMFSIAPEGLGALRELKSKVMAKNNCQPTMQPRIVKCLYYEDCLDYVFDMKWDNWTCANCPVFIENKDIRKEWNG